jgi:hypothetical protein
MLTASSRGSKGNRQAGKVAPRKLSGSKAAPPSAPLQHNACPTVTRARGAAQLLGVDQCLTSKPNPEMRAIHGRFVRRFLEHKAEASVAGLSDEQVVEQAPVIFETLMAVYVEAGRKGDRTTRDRLAWFTRACDEEFDEARKPPPHRPLH